MILGKIFGRKEKPKNGDDNPYIGLRNKVFTLSPEDLRIDLKDNGLPYCVMMETGYPNATATLVSFIDGNASLYLSTGGGVIGGIGHENVKQASQYFVAGSKEFINSMKITKQYPLPSQGNTIFYIFTVNGIYTHEENEDDLGNKRSNFSTLFYMGQNVITQLRLVTPQ